MAEALERCERELRSLLAAVGSSDAAGPAFAARVEGLNGLLAALPAQREGLLRVRALHALLQDAVLREQQGVLQQMQLARRVRAALAQAGGPGVTGDSCDVRGRAGAGRRAK